MARIMLRGLPAQGGFEAAYYGAVLILLFCIADVYVLPCFGQSNFRAAVQSLHFPQLL